MTAASRMPTRRALLRCCRRQLRGQDRDEDDVVDAQHQLERGEGGEGDPDFRIGELFHSKASDGEESRRVPVIAASGGALQCHAGFQGCDGLGATAGCIGMMHLRRGRRRSRSQALEACCCTGAKARNDGDGNWELLPFDAETSTRGVVADWGPGFAMAVIALRRFCRSGFSRQPCSTVSRRARKLAAEAAPAVGRVAEGTEERSGSLWRALKRRAASVTRGSPGVSPMRSAGQTGRCARADPGWCPAV